MKTKLEAERAAHEETKSILSWETARADQAERERDEVKRDLRNTRRDLRKQLNETIADLENCERKRDWLAAQLLSRID